MIVRSSRLAASVASICLAFSLSAATLEPPSQTLAPSTTASTIGTRCLACHESIVRSYRETGMARSLEPLRAGEFKGLAPVADGGTGFSYHFVEEGKSARIVESWNDPKSPPAATPAFQASADLAFAIGAGHLDRSY